MPGLAATLAQLAGFRHPDTAGFAEPTGPSGLVELHDFGANPGALRMLSHVPSQLPRGAPLVVVLHGCTQTAAAYDYGAGWSTLADRHGFAVLLPEQVRANNANLCFNWFQPEDTERGGGEALSIRQMISRMIADHRIDPARVFITGLSAGGAMTATMLAAYPEVFAGGAVIAGLPAGAATSVNAAFAAMFQGVSHSGPAWGDMVRAASPHRGPWPLVQIWHGDADHTVKPSNAGELVKQWVNVLGVPEAPTVVDTVDGASHQAWRGRDGRVALELFMVPGMAHGTPLDTGSADMDHGAGSSGAFMLDAGISSTWHIARAFGLLTAAAQARTAPRPPAASESSFKLPLAIAARLSTSGPGEVINKALRSAGLLGRG